MSLTKEETEHVRNLLYLALEVLDQVCRPNKPESNVKNHNTYQDSQYDLKAIKWLDKHRNPADFDAPWSWCYIFDLDKNVHPEVEPLYDQVCKHGELEVQGWIISLAGNNDSLLNKRKPKEDH